MNHHTIPDGHRMDSQGRLVPESNIKPIDKMRDDVVRELFEKAERVNKVLADFKKEAFATIAAFVELSGNEYEVKLGGNKGNVTLLSFDGEIRVQRAIAENIQFDERLQAAKELIDACLRDWIKGASAEITTLVNDAFRVDQQGKIRTGSILALRRLDIQDTRWRKAMDAIGDAVQIVGTRSYVRFHKRGPDGNYQSLSLDIAGV